MGNADKAIRLLTAVVIAILYFTKVISGTATIVLGVLAIMFAVPSFISFYPLYLPFGISTNKPKK